MSQRPADAVWRRRVDRRELAGVDDGQLGARSVLAGGGATGDARSPDRRRQRFEDECSECHMPMARTEASAGGRDGEVFAHLPVGAAATRADRLAHDGVSCTICHQITDEKLGTPASFTGGYVVSSDRPLGNPPGPLMPGRSSVRSTSTRASTTIMHSATEFRQAEASHVRQSELCATCHTLFTKALGPRRRGDRRAPGAGAVSRMAAQRLPREQRSCQSCHMPRSRRRCRSPRCSASRARGSRAMGSPAATPSC